MIFVIKLTVFGIFFYWEVCFWDVQLNTEIDELEQEMLKIHSEYEEILACTEKILIQNSEFDCKIEFLITQNQEFTKDPRWIQKL